MKDASDLWLGELLAARLCHDLVGPVGAIANGVELLAEGGARADPEVVTLIGDSARRASRRLQFFRVAFGTASVATSGLREARKLAHGLVEGEDKLTLDWSEANDAAGDTAGRCGVKLSLLHVLLAADTLPRGGKIVVRTLATPPGLRLSVVASGPQARLADEVRAMLAGEGRPEDAAPKTVPALFAWRLARSFGGQISTKTALQDSVEFLVELPAGA